MNVGSVSSQVKLQMMDLEWQKKKHDINQKKNTENLTQDEILIQQLEEQAEEVRKGRDTEQIYTKLKTGGTLTADEISYLKEHDPESLAEYEKTQAEKKAYEQALKNCKTKEEVERVKMNRMGSFAAKAKAIANSPYIPKDKKLELMDRLNNEVCCIKDAHMKFTKSVVYKNLPEEAEIAEEKAQENEIQNDKMLAQEMEAAEKDNSSQKDVETKKTDEELNNIHIELDEIKYDIDTNERTLESKNLSFDKISQDIERFLRKNTGNKAQFVANV